MGALGFLSDLKNTLSNKQQKIAYCTINYSSKTISTQSTDTFFDTVSSSSFPYSNIIDYDENLNSIIIKQEGAYLILGSALFTACSSGATLTVKAYNNNRIIGQGTIRTSGTSWEEVWLSPALQNCNVNDEIKLSISNNSAASGTASGYLRILKID